MRNQEINRLYKESPTPGNGGVVTDMLKSMVNAAMEGEIDEKPKQQPLGCTNCCYGHTRKTVLCQAVSLSMQTPRYHSGTHDPHVLKYWGRKLGIGIDEVILSLYARGYSDEDARSLTAAISLWLTSQRRSH